MDTPSLLYGQEVGIFSTRRFTVCGKRATGTIDQMIFEVKTGPEHGANHNPITAGYRFLSDTAYLQNGALKQLIN